MKKIISLCLIAVALFYYFKSTPDLSHDLGDAPVKKSQNKQDNIVVPTSPKVQVIKKTIEPEKVKPIAASSLSEKEAQEAVVDLITKALSPDYKMEELIISFKKLGITPEINKEGDPSVGDVYTIRTQNNLPGTRYFHAQYESNANGGLHAQHFSVEFPPGPNSMANAVALLKSKLPGNIVPSTESSEFVRWQLDDGRHAFITVLSKEYIEQPNPFNAYTKDDIGTVQLTIEDDIHPEMGIGKPVNEDDESVSEEHDHEH